MFFIRQVNYNHLVVKCQILQECFLQNLCKNLKIWHIQIQGLFKDFQGLLKDPKNPVQNNWQYKTSCTEESHLISRLHSSIQLWQWMEAALARRTAQWILPVIWQ